MTRKDRCTVILKLENKELDQWVVADRPLTIGRGADNDITIDHDSVSRKHAVLEQTDDGYVIRDCGSLNGMTVNGTHVADTVVRDGDIIVIGESRLFIRIGSPRQTRLSEAWSFDSTMRTYDYDIRGTIENPGHLVETTENGEQTYALNRSIIIIGSDDAADLQIEGRLVAGYHVEIGYKEGSYTLRHIDGRRKVLVNGSAVKECVLTDGSSISIGGTTLVFKEPVRAESRQTTE